MKSLAIIILLLGLSACVEEQKYYMYDIKCYSNGTLMFHEEVITKYVRQHRGDTWWRTYEGRILKIHGDCVVKVKGVYYE